MTPKEEMFQISTELPIKKNDSLILGIRMPDGAKEIIINPNVLDKLRYIHQVYDDDLRLKSCFDVCIEEYCFMKG